MTTTDTRPPTPRREFELTTPEDGPFAYLKCRACQVVTRFVRGDERAMRVHKADHTCDPVVLRARRLAVAR